MESAKNIKSFKLKFSEIQNCLRRNWKIKKWRQWKYPETKKSWKEFNLLDRARLYTWKNSILWPLLNQ